MEGCRVNVEVAIGGSFDALSGWGHGFLDGGRAFAGVQREGVDIDQRGDFWIVAGFGDDGAPVAVPDKNHGPRLPVDHRIRELHVFGKRGLRLLYHSHRVPVLRQNVEYSFPAGTIGECTVDQYHVLDAAWPRRSGNSTSPLKQQSGPHEHSTERHNRIKLLHDDSPLSFSI